MQSLAENMKFIRKKRGYTQQQVADKIKIKRCTLKETYLSSIQN